MHPAAVIDRGQVPHPRTVRRNDGAQIQHPGPMLGDQPLDPQPTATLAAVTGDLQHRHALGPHLTERDDALSHSSARHFFRRLDALLELDHAFVGLGALRHHPLFICSAWVRTSSARSRHRSKSGLYCGAMPQPCMRRGLISFKKRHAFFELPQYAGGGVAPNPAPYPFRVRRFVAN